MKIQLIDSINGADKVLIGFGAEWAYDLNSADDEKKERILAGYSRVKELLEGKDYYILSICIDDLIYKVFEEDRVVTPCGGYSRLQCSEHLLTREESEKLKPGDACPKCGKKLDYNNVENPEYLEEGYLDRFAQYKKWLMGTVNRKLCILELGCGMQYPTVIRMAFDKVCMYNLKSTFYRVNRNLSQHDAANKERGISVADNSVDFILND